MAQTFAQSAAHGLRQDAGPASPPPDAPGGTAGGRTWQAAGVRHASRAILVLGPDRHAISGVSTHVDLLFRSSLARHHVLRHFRVGSEGRSEATLARVLRLACSPLALALQILRHRVAVVHINTSLNARAFWRDLAYLCVARLLGRRVVYQVHGGALPQAFFAGRPRLTALLRTVLHWPDLIVVLAHAELLAYRQFVPGRPVMAVPNGLDLAEYPPDPLRPERSAGVLRLCYVGRLAQGKGLEELVAAVGILRRRGVPVECSLAGAGPLEASLREAVTTAGLAGCVRFAGPVFGHAKRALLADADVFVLPSHAEGLPYAMMESMAAGVPVIVTPVGAIPDVVRQGVHGFLVPCRDAAAIATAAQRLHEDRELLACMGRACRRRIAGSYSLERLALDFARIYAQLGRSWQPERTGHPDRPQPAPQGSRACAP